MSRGPRKIANIADVDTSSVGMQERMNDGPSGSSISAIVVADSNVHGRVMCATKGCFGADATQGTVALLQILSTLDVGNGNVRARVVMHVPEDALIVLLSIQIAEKV